MHVGVCERTHGVGQEAAGRAARGELTVQQTGMQELACLSRAVWIPLVEHRV